MIILYGQEKPTDSRVCEFPFEWRSFKGTFGGVMSGMSWRALCEAVLAGGFGMALNRCLILLEVGLQKARKSAFIKIT